MTKGPPPSADDVIYGQPHTQKTSTSDLRPPAGLPGLPGPQGGAGPRAGGGEQGELPQESHRQEDGSREPAETETLVISDKLWSLGTVSHRQQAECSPVSYQRRTPEAQDPVIFVLPIYCKPQCD